MSETVKQTYLKKKEMKRKKRQMKLNQLDAEKLGMAVVHNQRIAKCTLDAEQLGDRLIAIKIKAYNNEVTIIGAHANHAGAGERKKEAFYNELEGKTREANRKNNCVVVVRDFNARLME